MATLVLGAAGAAVGGMVGGSILGISAATIGGAIGTALGSSVDAMLLSRLQPAQRVEGARLEALRVTSATEGAPIPAYTPFWGETGRREVLLEALRARMIGIAPDLAAPGALLVFRMAPGRLAKHCGVLTEGGRMIHAMQGAGVIETGCDRSWRRRTVAAFLFPREVR